MVNPGFGKKFIRDPEKNSSRIPDLEGEKPTGSLIHITGSHLIRFWSKTYESIT
jgi:hypothetical protein